MAQQKIQYLSTYLFIDDFFEMPGNVLKTSCYNVEDYKYQCYRKRDEFNNPFGPIMSGYMDITINTQTFNDCKVFYKRMEENESCDYSLIFNPEFNAFGRMTSFDDGMVVRGYVIDVFEACNNAESEDDEQLQITIRLMLNSVCFMGTDTLHELKISTD